MPHPSTPDSRGSLKAAKSRQPRLSPTYPARRPELRPPRPRRRQMRQHLGQQELRAGDPPHESAPEAPGSPKTPPLAGMLPPRPEEEGRGRLAGEAAFKPHTPNAASSLWARPRQAR